MGEVTKFPGARIDVNARGWRPIKTAPDKTPLLVWDERKLPTPVAIASRMTPGSAVWVAHPGGYLCRPTHWMPLPEPPQ